MGQKQLAQLVGEGWCQPDIFTKYRINFVKINKKVTNWGLKTPTWRALQGLSTETVYLCHSANAEDTILAGGSAASPKAPPYGSL